MADWQRKLNIADLHANYRAEKITVQQLAEGVAKRLRKLKPFGAFEPEELDEERDDIVCEFEQLANDADADINAYNDVLERLYDWADTPLNSAWPPKKVCWVETFGGSASG
jgi:hypothetical protein